MSGYAKNVQHFTRTVVEMGGASRERIARLALALLGPCFPLAFATACEAPAQREEGPQVVIVSVPPQAYFVERIAGDRVGVEVMIPAGASPHLYEPGMHRMRALAGASVYIGVGHPRMTFEREWMSELRGTNPGLRVVRSGEDCRSLRDDPHMWLSPRCAERMTVRAAEALEVVLPEHGAEIRERARELRMEITRVDREIRELLAPHAGESFLVFHPAWGYFAREYGLRQVAIHAGAREPGPAELSRLLRSARASGTGVVFGQPRMSRQAVDLVARELGVEVRMLDPLDRNWSENLLRVAEELRSAFADDAPGSS